MDINFETEFLKKNPRYPHIIGYMKEALGQSTITWMDMTKVNLDNIREYIMGKVAPNTAMNYLAIIKAFLGKYSEEELVPCKKAHDVLKSKRQPSQHVFLTEEEIDKLEEYVPRTEKEKSVWDAFLTECYLGARASDIETITQDNIKGDGVEQRIVYVSKKTHVETSVPIHQNLLKHLLATKKNVSMVYYDKTIKEICRICGIDEPVKLFNRGKETTQPKYKFVSSHTARRSFATNLRLRGVSISEICALMNHNKNEQMTARYICIDTRYLTSHAMSFFNKS